MDQFDALYDQQYAVALFNKVRFDVEGGGGPQPQLLHRKVKATPSPPAPSLHSSSSEISFSLSVGLARVTGRCILSTGGFK